MWKHPKHPHHPASYRRPRHGTAVFIPATPLGGLVRLDIIPSRRPDRFYRWILGSAVESNL